MQSLPFAEAKSKEKKKVWWLLETLPSPYIKDILRQFHHNHREVLSRLMLVTMKMISDLGTGQSHRAPSCLLPGLLVTKGMVWVTLELPELQGLGTCSWGLEVSLSAMTKSQKVEAG